VNGGLGQHKLRCAGHRPCPGSLVIKHAVERPRLGRRAATDAERLDFDREPAWALGESEDIPAAHAAAGLLQRRPCSAAYEADTALFDLPRGEAAGLEKARAPQPDVDAARLGCLAQA